jgi:hypothetical protein
LYLWGEAFAGRRPGGSRNLLVWVFNWIRDFFTVARGLRCCVAAVTLRKSQ